MGGACQQMGMGKFPHTSVINTLSIKAYSGCQLGRLVVKFGLSCMLHFRRSASEHGPVSADPHGCLPEGGGKTVFKLGAMILHEFSYQTAVGGSVRYASYRAYKLDARVFIRRIKHKPGQIKVSREHVHRTPKIMTCCKYIKCRTGQPEESATQQQQH